MTSRSCIPSSGGVSSEYNQAALTVLSLGKILDRIRICALKEYEGSIKRCRQCQPACGEGKGG